MRSPRLAVMGVATLSRLMPTFLVPIFTATITRPDRTNDEDVKEGKQVRSHSFLSSSFNSPKESAAMKAVVMLLAHRKAAWVTSILQLVRPPRPTAATAVAWTWGRRTEKRGVTFWLFYLYLLHIVITTFCRIPSFTTEWLLLFSDCMCWGWCSELLIGWSMGSGEARHLETILHCCCASSICPVLVCGRRQAHIITIVNHIMLGLAFKCATLMTPNATSEPTHSSHTFHLPGGDKSMDDG